MIMSNNRHISILSGGRPDMAPSAAKSRSAGLQRLAIDLQWVSGSASNSKMGGEA